ncbi:MAG: AIR synthase family protein [Aigarchaeota archaeon]|nr:AIR synthase family protein [Aigarchaeota archaeon]
MVQKDLPRIGKLTPEVFNEIIFPKTGASDCEVLVGPKHGFDAAVLRVGDKVMVVAEDPTFGVPSWGWKQFGWGVVHICASDVAVFGVRPKYMTICLLLPLNTQRSVLEEIWNAIHEECVKLGITIVGGHTGVYGGISYPLNGGCTMWGFADDGKYVTPGGAQVGDKILITKGAAIEATAILALQYPKTLTRAFGHSLVKRAQDLYWQMSVVEDALTAFDAGGVTAMHDATEGGVLGGIYEVAEASNVGVKVYLDRIKISEETKKICEFFGIDPYKSISEGTLVLTVRPNSVESVVNALKIKGIEAMVVGEVTDPAHGRIVVSNDGKEFELEFPDEDPFWKVFFETLEKPDV